MASVAQTPQDVPEWRRQTEPSPDSRPRRASTRESNRGNRGGRGRGRGGNGGGPPRKESTSASQDTAAPAPKVVVDPPTSANTPQEPSPTPKSNTRSKPAKRNSATISEDSTSVSPHTSARPQRGRRSQQGRRPSVSSNSQSKHLTVQTLSRKAVSEPSSPNPSKDLPPHLAETTPSTTGAELRNDIDALVERVRSVAMDRPHTPGSHLDWADDDDSLPDLNDWGYPGDVAGSTQAQEPPASIPPILEDAPLETVIPEVKIEEEPSRDENKSQSAEPRPVSDAPPRTHKVQKARPKRVNRLGGNSRSQQTPPTLNLAEAAPQDPSLSPVQPASPAVTPQTSKPQGSKRRDTNQGPNSRNNRGQTSSRDLGGGNSGNRQRGQSGAAVAPPLRNSFPAKPGPKVDHTPVQTQTPAQGPDIQQPVTDLFIESESKPAEAKVDPMPGKEGKKTEPPPKTDVVHANPNSTVSDDVHELEPIQDDVRPNNQRKRNSHNPSHSRSHTYGGRTQGGPPHSASTPSFPHHSPGNDQSSPIPRNTRPQNSRHSPHLPGLGHSPKSAGFERHNRNHSSPPGVGGTTRRPQSSRPVLTENAFGLVTKSLGSTPSSPRKDPPAPSSTS